MCYLGNPGPLLAGTLLGQVWAEREEKLRGGAGKAKASRLSEAGIYLAGTQVESKQETWLKGMGTLDRQAFRHQSSSLIELRGEEVKQCRAFSLPLPRRTLPRWALPE